MKKSIIAVLAVFLAAALFIGAGSAVTIFPYTNVSGYGLNVGDTLYLIEQPNTVIKLIGDNNNGVYFTDTNLVAGTYSIDVGNKGANFVVSKPDAQLKISLADRPSSDMNGKTVSSSSGLNFTVIQFDSNYTTVKSLEFTTPVGATTTFLGTLNSGNVSYWSDNTFMVEKLSDYKVASGTWKVAAKLSGTFLNQSSGSLESLSKTASTKYSFTVASTAESITANKDEVTRGNSFLVTIKGTPGDKVDLIYDNDIYLLEGQGQNKAINSDAKFSITLGDSGSKSIQFDTNSSTSIKSHKITANFTVANVKKDVKVNIVKGAITIKSDKDSYYIGNEVTLSGTNTETDHVYLYIKGSNVDLQVIPTTSGYLKDGILVESDDTWSKKFTFANDFDAGTYTIYAVANGYWYNSTSGSDEEWKVHGLTTVEKDYVYATAAVTLKQPFLTATAASNVIAKGDKIEIKGQVEGTPDNLIYYVFGTNIFKYKAFSPEDDGTYSQEIETGDLATGQYFVVIQHPMYDNLFNVQPGNYKVPAKKYILNGTNTPAEFSPNSNEYDIYSYATDNQSHLLYRDYISYIKSRQTANAAQAVCDLIDEEYVDDIYVKLDFTVANAYITINAIADQKQGATFTVSGTTNVKVDELVTIDVISTKFQAEPKASVSAASYLVQTAKVVAGSNGINTYSASFDGTPLALDAYTAVATITRSTTNDDLKVSTTFNIVSAPATPTATATGTTAPTTPTATATQTPAKTPGFGALIALAGLGAVAVLVLRRQ